MLNDFTEFEEPFGYWVKVVSDGELEFQREKYKYLSNSIVIKRKIDIIDT